MSQNKDLEKEDDVTGKNHLQISEEELKMENLISTYERIKSELICFDRIENDRIYLGFTLDELDEVLKSLERYCPDEEIKDRLTALFLAFTKFKRREKW